MNELELQVSVWADHKATVREKPNHYKSMFFLVL